MMVADTWKWLKGVRVVPGRGAGRPWAASGWRLLLLLLLALASAGRPARGQAALPCLLLPLSPAERVAAVPLVVEAEVRSARGEWDTARRHLFTRQQLRVFRVLKGSLPDTAWLPLLVEGGQVGLTRQELTNTLGPLPVGQQGIFFLYPAPWAGVAPAWAAYASQQGFIAYDLTRNVAAEPARLYATPARAVAQTLALTGQPAQVLHPNPAFIIASIDADPAVGQRPQAPSISSFAPTQATAGTGTVLTVRGSGFGSSRGSGGVEFRNADDGGATTTRALDLDYLSWSDTQVQVRVPSAGSGGHPAGTGPVRVVTADGGAVESSAALTVVYALTNVTSTDNTILDQPNHVATNGAGGLTFQFGTSFAANAAATAAWGRALTRWRCATGVNWTQGGPAASNDVGADNVNAVVFDAGTLPARVLGRTTSYYQGCFDPLGGVVFYVAEIDQQYSGSLPFQYGPTLAGVGQYDFESVATHELGHAQQLNHLIRPGAVMHYAIAAAANLRALDAASDIAGGRQVLRTRSFRNRGCGGTAMLPAPLTSLAASPGTASFIFTTRDECLVSGFVLQRAAGTDTTATAANWQTIASATATGAGTYRLTDAQPPTTGLRYYRLGVRRPDGSTDYAAPLLPGTASADVAQVFPNPGTGDLLQLAYPTPAAGLLTLYFYDSAGRYLRRQQVTAPAGLSLLTLSAAGLTPGLYLLRIVGETTQTVKVVRY